MNGDLNASVTRLDEPLVGPAGGPLTRRTMLVEDLIDTAGIRTTCGKANLPEFAWSVLGQNPWFGTVHNPTQPGKTTGGSSSGNAAALAAGLCDFGIGLDTRCSIRLPAAACDIVGLKLPGGVIPMDGVFPLVPTIDTVGPMGRSVEDVALLWSVGTTYP